MSTLCTADSLSMRHESARCWMAPLIALLTALCWQSLGRQHLAIVCCVCMMQCVTAFNIVDRLSRKVRIFPAALCWMKCAVCSRGQLSSWFCFYMNWCMFCKDMYQNVFYISAAVILSCDRLTSELLCQWLPLLKVWTLNGWHWTDGCWTKCSM